MDEIEAFLFSQIIASKATISFVFIFRTLKCHPIVQERQLKTM